jgi:hypothetical protein
MAVRIYSPEEQRARSRALQAVHADWADRQIAAGVDGPTPPDRKEPSDYNQHVPDLEASGEALDEFWARADEALR